LQALVSNGVSLSVRGAVAAAASLQPVKVSEAQQTAVVEYIGGRLEQLVAEQGVQVEVGECAEWLHRDSIHAALQ
jgi:glycyl-tRNA synthetase